MDGKVVEDVVEFECVFNLNLVDKFAAFDDKVRVWSEKSLWRLFDDGLEAVADESEILQIYGIPVIPQKIVGELFGTVRQIEERWSVGQVFSLFVFSQYGEFEMFQD